jgi:NIMA (never in mitosis gene a)-related kinase
MEYCQHHDLCSYIKKQNGKPFVENFIWKVFIHICLGVHYLHSRDIIHRDLKSLNIFLTKDNSAKVGDLGASRKIDENGNIEDDFNEPGTPQNHKVGTPFYLAPELWNDKPCSKKSDIWALGVILYEICAL